MLTRRRFLQYGAGVALAAPRALPRAASATTGGKLAKYVSPLPVPGNGIVVATPSGPQHGGEHGDSRERVGAGFRTGSMAHYNASLETLLSPAEAFAYLSDFSSTEEWDPGVVEAERLGDGPVGKGTEFRVVAKFLGRESTLVYEIVEFEPGKAVTLRGENGTVVSLDRISFEPVGAGTRVGYDADLRLKGPLRVADPLLGLAFGRVGDRALGGLRATLARKASEGRSRTSGRAGR